MIVSGKSLAINLNKTTWQLNRKQYLKKTPGPRVVVPLVLSFFRLQIGLFRFNPFLFYFKFILFKVQNVLFVVPKPFITAPRATSNLLFFAFFPLLSFFILLSSFFRSLGSLFLLALGVSFCFLFPVNVVSVTVSSVGGSVASLPNLHFGQQIVHRIRIAQFHSLRHNFPRLTKKN